MSVANVVLLRFVYFFKSTQYVQNDAKFKQIRELNLLSNLFDIIP